MRSSNFSHGNNICPLRSTNSGDRLASIAAPQVEIVESAEIRNASVQCLKFALFSQFGHHCKVFLTIPADRYYADVAVLHIKAMKSASTHNLFAW
jgi:hypothetical protein